MPTNTRQLTFPHPQSATLISPGLNPDRLLAQIVQIVSPFTTTLFHVKENRLLNPYDVIVFVGLDADQLQADGRQEAEDKPPAHCAGVFVPS